ASPSRSRNNAGDHVLMRSHERHRSPQLPPHRPPVHHRDSGCGTSVKGAGRAMMSWRCESRFLVAANSGQAMAMAQMAASTVFVIVFMAPSRVFRIRGTTDIDRTDRAAWV